MPCTRRTASSVYKWNIKLPSPVTADVIGQELSHMSFRKSKNQTDQWRAFCTKHDRYVSQLPRLAPVFANADRFDQFLQSGVYDGDNAMLTIMSLTDPEWPPFSLFVDQYSTDWQSYFTDTMYVAYHREHDKRHWQPATTRFVRDDLRLPKLIVHFWAKWDAHDRNMDANLRPAIEQFDDNVEFRSLDIDVPQLHDVCREAGIVKVPSLAFYSNGDVDRVLVGVCEPAAIINDIATWLAETKPDNHAVNRSGEVGRI
ncbi:thioredoxin family protein [Neorhodopirellula pilleata]|uniref:Thioredoxin-1 n=1 Tax=Neorhodopirellula pilleata TaxID=2714738 RepID=A0A5C6AAH9_9BACT|nr:thioredoxin family protein [Neorhodopirellula pilleata]TWT96446.1 Thioredoxin-1 [Neorhodopirellula pilleata]